MTILLSRHSVGTYPETSSHTTCQGTFWLQSSQLTEPLWTDPGTKSGISVCKLISTLKKKKAGGNEWSYILLKFLQSEEKATTTVIHWGLSTNVAKWQEKNFPAASMYNCLGSLASWACPEVLSLMCLLTSSEELHIQSDIPARLAAKTQRWAHVRPGPISGPCSAEH